MLSIAQIVASVNNEASGPSYTVPRLSLSLAGMGHSVRVVTLGRSADRRTDLLAAGVRHDLYPPDEGWPPLARQVGASQAMRDALRVPEHDIYHTHGLWLMPNVYPAAAARLKAKPFVISPRGMLGRDALAYSRWKKQAFWIFEQASAARQASCFHATSESEYEDIRAFGLRQPVAVIPNGVDLPDPDGIADGDAQGEAGPYVLSLSRLHPKKGLDRLIAAWRLVEPEFSGWRLRIVGPDEGNHAAALKRMIATLRLGSVTVEEPVFGPEKFALLSKASLFVLPTRHENFAMTVAESLAVGTPVISTRGAPWQGLVVNDCGWWIEHGPEPMAVALRDAMRLSPEALGAKGERGRCWMVRDFGWRAIACSMADAYHWLLSGGAPPPCIRLD